MNYKQRFDKIVKNLGKRKKVKGIDRIYYGSDDFITIVAEGLEITRGCGGELLQIAFIDIPDWEIIRDLPEKIEEWFNYVEDKVDDEEELIEIDGKKVSKATIKEALKEHFN